LLAGRALHFGNTFLERLITCRFRHCAFAS
jgi:hypothetical protein